MYKPNEYLEESVRDKNLVRIRGALSGIMGNDRAFGTSEIYDAIKYVKDSGVNIFVEENDPTLEMETNPECWDLSYYSKAIVYFENNCTEERLEHAIAVCNHLKKKKPVSVIRNEPEIIHDEPTTVSEAPKPKTGKVSSSDYTAKARQRAAEAKRRRAIAIATATGAFIAATAVAITLLTK